MIELLLWIVTAISLLAGAIAALVATQYLPTFVAVAVLPFVLLVTCLPRPERAIVFACAAGMSALVALATHGSYRAWLEDTHAQRLGDPSPWSWWPLGLTVFFAVLWCLSRPRTTPASNVSLYSHTR